MSSKLSTDQAAQESDTGTLWLDRVIRVFTDVAHATRTEYLEAGLPSKPIAGTSFRTVPVNMHLALAEGREGVQGLIGEGAFVFTTLTTSFRTFVTEDHAADPTLPRTLQFARELTSLRRRAARQRIQQEMQVS
jgi:hypothetical protein